ncbi:MAG: hypothetical protein HKN22_01170 [Bacteroidia bacterium]|nr:hypothetical protein [Bacteroidia bacterium]
MDVHLIRSTDFPEADYDNVVALLQSYPGIIRFIETDFCWDFDEESYEIREYEQEEFEKREVTLDAAEYQIMAPNFPVERPVVSWDEIFKACDAYRKYADVGHDMYVHIFTDMYNEHNWFSAVSDDGRSGFTHTADWDYFIGSDKRFPIAFVTAEEILEKHMFSSTEEVMNNVHKIPRGCINDFCENKPDIHLKLRTADICEDCLKIVREKNVDPKLFSQVMSIVEGIREQMTFKSRFEVNQLPSRLKISGFTLNISLPDMGDQRIPLTPKQKAIYLLYLFTDELFPDTNIPDKRPLLANIYRRVTNLGDLAGIENVISNLVDLVDGDLQQVRSKINRKFTDIVGEEMAQYYRISGGRNSPKGIKLDREMVEMEEPGVIENLRT